MGVGFFKLLFLAGAVAAVWYLFRMLASPSQPPAEPEPRAQPHASNAAARSRADAEDMVACKVCGTYVSATAARSCGRGDCPQRG
jgi:hypothetical protein